MKITKISAIVFLITIISEMMNAQDTIYFKDKSIISSKIIEIGITEIQYHRFDNLTGPIYRVIKEETNLTPVLRAGWKIHWTHSEKINKVSQSS